MYHLREYIADRLYETFPVCEGSAPASLHRYCLEVLGTHDGPDTAAACCSCGRTIVDNCCEPHTLLSRNTDSGNFHLLTAVLSEEHLGFIRCLFL